MLTLGCNLQATSGQDAGEHTLPPYCVSPVCQSCGERVASNVCRGGNPLKTAPQKKCCLAALQVLVFALAAAELWLTAAKVLLCGSLHSPDTCPDFSSPLQGAHWPASTAPYFTKAVTGSDNATCQLDNEESQGWQQSVWLTMLASQGCQEHSFGQLLPFLLLTSDVALCCLYMKNRSVRTCLFILSTNSSSLRQVPCSSAARQHRDVLC